MFLDRLLNQGNAPLLEQTVKFASERHRLILENIANVSTPGYRQKDLSLAKFQANLRDRIEARRSGASARFDDMKFEESDQAGGILFHDGSNRSMEQLASDLSKNALMHNLAVELLKKQFTTMEMALRERIA